MIALFAAYYRMILFGYLSNINFFFTIPATSYSTPLRFIIFEFASLPLSSAASVTSLTFLLRSTANGFFNAIDVPLSSWFPIIRVGAP